MPRAAIDVGSNSILLVIVDDEGRVLEDEVNVVGLGRGLGDRGLFAPDRMAAGEEVLREYIALAAKHDVGSWSIEAVATSGARRAMNATTWLSRVQRKMGLRVRIITGSEEAALTWRGATDGLPQAETLLLIDLGGGSTELVLGKGAEIERSTSMEVGSVRLTEEFLGMEVPDPTGIGPMKNRIDTEILQAALDGTATTVVGVAGTVTSLATMALGLEKWDADAVHHSALTRADLEVFIARLTAANPQERRAMVPASPERADYLLAGATILDMILAATGHTELIVSDRGLRYGLLATNPT